MVRMGWDETVAAADVLRPAVIAALRDRVPLWLNRKRRTVLLGLVEKWEQVQSSGGDEGRVLGHLDVVFSSDTYDGLPESVGVVDRELCHALGHVISWLRVVAREVASGRHLVPWPWSPEVVRALGPWLSPEDVLLVSLLLDGLTVDEARETVVACLT